MAFEIKKYFLEINFFKPDCDIGSTDVKNKIIA